MMVDPRSVGGMRLVTSIQVHPPGDFMTFRALGRAFICAALFASAPVCLATGITYSLTALGDNAWRYDYRLSNTDFFSGLNEFTIFFDRNAFSTLRDLNAPVGWDPIVGQPDLSLPDDGFYDALTTTSVPITSTISGFGISFLYLLNGTPGPQPFNLIRSSDFTIIFSGITEPRLVSSVPEPGTYLLFMLGILWMIAAKSKSLRRPIHYLVSRTKVF